MWYLDNLFYRLYAASPKDEEGGDRMWIAWLVLAPMLSFNLFNVVQLITSERTPLDGVLYFFIFFIISTSLIVFYSSKKRYKKVIKRFKRHSVKKQIIGMLVFWAHVILSAILLYYSFSIDL